MNKKIDSDSPAVAPVEPSSMTEPLVDGEGAIDPGLIDRLLTQSKGRELLGAGGLVQQFTKQLLETALDTELTDYLGYDRGDPSGRGSGNSRNGMTPKRVRADVGTVDNDVPRDRNGISTRRSWPRASDGWRGSTTGSSLCTAAA